MTTRRTVKKTNQLIVGVIASPADLRFAVAMRRPPDLFEIRLDCLVDVLDQVEKKLSILSARGRTRSGELAPIIITARDPREGGGRAARVPVTHPTRVVLKRVLDTNAILYLLGSKLAQPLPAGQYFISVISEMELLCYPLLEASAQTK